MPNINRKTPDGEKTTQNHTYIKTLYLLGEKKKKYLKGIK